MNDRIVLEKERKQLTGISRSTAWRLEQKGRFPKRRQVSDGLVGWLESEINEWISSRPVTAKVAFHATTDPSTQVDDGI